MFASHKTGSVATVIVFVSLANGINYPRPERGTVQDSYFGTTVQDPYRWMEDPDAEATKSFVNAQNTLSSSYFKQYPFREQIADRLDDATRYSRIYIPERRGKYTFEFVDDGKQHQNVLYVQDAEDGEDNNRRILLDPNTFSDDGTIALTYPQSFSDDGEMFAYGTSVSGSDWRTVHFMNVSTGEILNDVLTKVRYTNLVWKGNEGIFYGHFPDFEGNPEGDNTGMNENNKISYHRVGTPQSEDVIVVEFLDKPHNLINNIQITRNDEYLLVTLNPSAADRGSWEQTAVYYVDLTGNNPAKWQTRTLVEEFVAAFNFIADVNGTLYFHTNFNAPRYKVVGIRLTAPDPASWTTMVEEDAESILLGAAPINNEYVLLHYLENVSSKLVLRSLIQGNSFSKTIKIEKGYVSECTSFNDSIVFIKFHSHLVPHRIYKLDFATNVSDIELEVYKDVEMERYDPSLFTVKQVWYPSRDGTQVPMYIMHKKDLVLDGSSPAMLYGYGGFNGNVVPGFLGRRIVFMQSLNGVAAIANIRGGGEFGDAWHKAGSLLNKQNTFDDFHAAAEYLIARNYTSASKMIIEGASNGALLVTACVNQRPELYGAAIATIGVMDMLRYQKFTVGHTWVSEFGSSEDPVHFQNIYKYSPLHNIRFPTTNGTQYPAVLVITGDHDDRAVPSHSYKYAAELQYKIGSNEKQTRPLLLRVYKNAGHGSGLTLHQLFYRDVDILSFISESLDLTFEEQKPHASGVNVRCSIVTIIMTMVSVVL